MTTQKYATRPLNVIKRDFFFPNRLKVIFVVFRFVTHLSKESARSCKQSWWKEPVNIQTG